MVKVENNFEERLKKYSEKIKNMEIVYRDGRVRWINKNDKINSKNRETKDETIKNQEDESYTNDEEYSFFKNIYCLIIKKIFLTFIVLISIPFIATEIVNIGVNEFISGIGTIFIYYFIINIIWVFSR